ncbi:hypothetical protein KJ695_03465 [Patescibacteria group bacterium]|nr:hypothetical protein [Patescibacteria group bacterium]MBU4056939.1 hypothetical protein [Patescibacteria group bacterium]MBU4368802.1 hypothetical protein [Patescibacteria group bacterium]
MNGVLTLNNLTDPFFLQAISISQIEESGKALEQAEALGDKFLLLKKDVGDELFNQLSYTDRIFMIETAGSINFGHAIDLDKIAQDIREYDNY